jgi:hypothetical protein
MNRSASVNRSFISVGIVRRHWTGSDSGPSRFYHLSLLLEETGKSPDARMCIWFYANIPLARFEMTRPLLIYA